MILSELTVSKFGYLPEDLTHASTKLVYIQCDFCNHKFTRKWRQMLKGTRGQYPHACPTCDQIKSNWVKNNPIQLIPTQFFKTYQKSGHYAIDEESTKTQFGYTTSQIGPKSEKKIIVNCDFCLKQYITNLQTLTRSQFACCRQCAAIAASYVRNSSLLTYHEFWKTKQTVVDFSKIDINRTNLEFQYDPHTVSPLCERKIYLYCHICGQSTLINRFSFATRKQFKIACKNCISILTKQTLQIKYGVSNTLEIPEVKKKLKSPSTELLVKSILEERYQVKFIQNHSIGPYSFDFFLPDQNLLIECQGDYFHDFKNNGYEGTAKDKAKSTYIEKYTNYKLIWIWEHELHIGRIRKILDYHIYSRLEPKIELNKQQLEFKICSKESAFKFLASYHYLGNLGTAASPYGAYLDNILIVVAIFGGLTRKESSGKISKQLNVKLNQIRELRRFCIKPNIECKNLASYSLSKFLKLFKQNRPEIEAVVSFADLTVGDTGVIYKASGWNKLSNTSKSYHYLDPETLKPIHKKVIYELAKKAHITEFKFVQRSGLIKIQEIEKSSWIKIY